MRRAGLPTSTGGWCTMTSTSRVHRNATVCWAGQEGDCGDSENKKEGAHLCSSSALFSLCAKPFLETTAFCLPFQSSMKSTYSIANVVLTRDDCIILIWFQRVKAFTSIAASFAGLHRYRVSDIYIINLSSHCEWEMEDLNNPTQLLQNFWQKVQEV